MGRNLRSRVLPGRCAGAGRVPSAEYKGSGQNDFSTRNAGAAALPARAASGHALPSRLAGRDGNAVPPRAASNRRGGPAAAQAVP